VLPFDLFYNFIQDFEEGKMFFNFGSLFLLRIYGLIYVYKIFLFLV